MEISNDDDVTKLQLPKKKAEFLLESINYWKKNSIINEDDYYKLLNSFEPMNFDFSKLAKYSFWISMICLVVSFFSVVLDQELLKMLMIIFNASSEVKFIILAFVSALIYSYGIKLKKLHPETIYKNESILLVGNMVAAGALFFFSDIIKLEDKDSSYIFLLSTVIYGAVAYIYRSKFTWIVAIFSLASYYGLFIGYISGRGTYVLNITHPLYFFFFSLFLISSSFLFKEKTFLIEFRNITYKMGLLFMFVSLWILSIFGNYKDFASWLRVKQIVLFHWSLLFALTAIGAIYYGLKNDDYASRSFGIVFLIINIYTRFFEYFWDSTNKFLFFLIISLSFWLIGSRAEKIWNIGKNSN